MRRQISASERDAFLSSLRRLRLQAGFTQTDLAARLGKPQSFVSKYESGERRLDVLELRQICQALGAKLAVFVSELERSLGKRR